MRPVSGEIKRRNEDEMYAKDFQTGLINIYRLCKKMDSVYLSLFFLERLSFNLVLNWNRIVPTSASTGFS